MTGACLQNFQACITSYLVGGWIRSSVSSVSSQSSSSSMLVTFDKISSSVIAHVSNVNSESSMSMYSSAVISDGIKASSLALSSSSRKLVLGMDHQHHPNFVAEIPALRKQFVMVAAITRS